MKMSNVIDFYSSLVKIKYIFRDFYPLSFEEPFDYLTIMCIEEINEADEIRDSVRITSLLEVSDLIGVYALMCQCKRISFKKFKPMLCNNLDQMKIKTFKILCGYLRRKEAYNYHVVLDAVYNFICSAITTLNDNFLHYDFYKLCYTLICINGTKMIARERIHNQVVFFNFKLSILLNDFYNFIELRIKEMKSLDVKEKTFFIDLIQANVKGGHAW